MILGPGVNIYRTARRTQLRIHGRSALSRIADGGALHQGLQSCGVSACVKHYALNNDEEYRHAG